MLNEVRARYNEGMTNQMVEAVFQNGVFLPVGPLRKIEEGQHVRLFVEVNSDVDVVELAGQVFDDLAEDEMREVEAIALERRGFSGASTAWSSIIGILPETI